MANRTRPTALLAAEPARMLHRASGPPRPSERRPLGTAVGAGPGSLDDDDTQVAVYF
jgi:hypothetical protein